MITAACNTTTLTFIRLFAVHISGVCAFCLAILCAKWKCVAVIYFEWGSVLQIRFTFRSHRTSICVFGAIRLGLHINFGCDIHSRSQCCLSASKLMKVKVASLPHASYGVPTFARSLNLLDFWWLSPAHLLLLAGTQAGDTATCVAAKVRKQQCR